MNSALEVDSDLAVERWSNCLDGRTLDVIVSGSVGAVSSVAFIRVLRRFGARVRPWLTSGGQRFVGEDALSWAAASPCLVGPQPDASHIGSGDGVVVAPASASFVARVVAGGNSCPASTLVQSYLGQGKPVVVVPCGHTSLFRGPFARRNLEDLTRAGVMLPLPREGENKWRFPDPEILAHTVAHQVNAAHSRESLGALITVGSDQAPIDSCRVLANYSSGALGSEIAEELYRHGIRTTVIACTGGGSRAPRVASELLNVGSHQALEECLRSRLDGPPNLAAAVYCAAVLDYIPSSPVSEKIRSGQETLQVTLQPTPKLLDIHGNQSMKVRVGFKLEPSANPATLASLSQNYLAAHSLTMLVVTARSEVSPETQTSWILGTAGPGPIRVEGKREIARAVAGHVIAGLRGTPC